MQQQSQAPNNTMVYREEGDNTFQGHSIKIILPPKPGEEGDNWNGSYGGTDEGESRMDVCALTLSCLAQDPNLPSSKLPFAWKLYEMLETVHKNEVDTDIVSWVDNGYAFKVHDLKRFVDEIVPTYFKQSKYKSFQRQLYFYGFIRETSSGKEGHTPGSYRHPKFIRGKKTLCLSMAPKKAKKRGGRKSPVPDSTATAAVTNIVSQDSHLTAQPDVVRKVSSELGNDSINSIAAYPLHPMAATMQTANSNSNTRHSSNNNDMVQMPFYQEFKSTDTIPTSNVSTNRQHRMSHRGVNPQQKFQQQQNQLQKLQMEGFLRSLHQEDRQNISVPPQAAPILRTSVSDGRECNIFGGTFHVVGRKKSS